MALSLTTASTVRSVKTAESGDRTATDLYSNTSRASWTDGTGAGACDRVYASPSTTVGTVADSWDLSGSLANAISESVIFTAVKVAEFTAPSTNTGTVRIYGSTSLLCGTLSLPPGSRITCEATGGTTWAVSAGTNDTFYVVASTGTQTYQHFHAGQ